MEREPKRLAAPNAGRIELEAPIGRGTRAFLVFLVCCAVLVATFAISRIWVGRQVGSEDGSDAFPNGSDESGGLPTTEREASDETPIPADATPICSLDLSGVGVRNETALSVDLEAVRAMVSSKAETRVFQADRPVVLILHTHAQECYRSEERSYIAGEIGDAIYSNDSTIGVIAVGETLCAELNRCGVPTIHCTDLHGEGGTLRGAYSAAADCIRAYLDAYPSIEYVIDLHRDSVLTEQGDCVRTLSRGGEAQVMAVVGSDGGGEDCPAWRSNLGLALCLMDRLQQRAEGICRQTILRNATYNQELAPHSFLLEIGSAGNTVSEAKAVAVLVGQSLADLILSGNGT